MIPARLLAAVSAVLWAFVFFGLIDLSVPLDKTPGFYESYLLETGWGVLYTFLVGAAFAALVVRPVLVLPAVQVGLVGLALGVTAVASGSLVQLVPAVLLVGNAYAVLRLAGLRLPAGPVRLDPALTVLTAVLLVPAAVFAVDMVDGYRSGRPPTDDDTWGIDHWPTQAALALAVVLVSAAVAAGVRGRWPGAGLSAACVVLTTGWFGVVSAVYPDHAGSIGTPWGPALVAWALLFAATTAWRHHVRR
ncbi:MULTISPECIES: hypothetical protein [unclassified Nocardioides]|uniref:hypothetical protein n=1 Tax=Nocardioides sp. URHA0032 TaxID=1380388 RepID=UPI00048A8C7C|nr:hypothetical protein [Nocardioides sp. URHA0032]